MADPSGSNAGRRASPGRLPAAGPARAGRSATSDPGDVLGRPPAARPDHGDRADPLSPDPRWRRGDEPVRAVLAAASWAGCAPGRRPLGHGHRRCAAGPRSAARAPSPPAAARGPDRRPTRPESRDPRWRGGARPRAVRQHVRRPLRPAREHPARCVRSRPATAAPRVPRPYGHCALSVAERRRTAGSFLADGRPGGSESLVHGHTARD